MKTDKKKIIRRTAMLLGKIVLVAVAVYLVLHFLFGFHYFRGNYMFPNVKDGDAVITFKLEPIVKNDVVLYTIENEDGTKEKRLGRVVAQEGDIVNFTSDGELLVNNSIVTEEIFYATVPSEYSDISFPYTVPEGMTFVLNDYRSDTSVTDSRVFGAVDNDDLNGKVWILFRRRGF